MFYKGSMLMNSISFPLIRQSSDHKNELCGLFRDCNTCLNYFLQYLFTYGSQCVGRIVTQSMSYFLYLCDCALLCLPGRLELGSSWTAPQCESNQVISLAKSKYYNVFRQIFVNPLNCHISSTVRVFDPIPKLIARPKYQLYSGTKYINVWLASVLSWNRNDLELSG